MPASPLTPDRSRLAFVDAARALAMLMMVQGHVSDLLHSPAAKQSALYEQYWMLRGLTAPLFLFISGFAVVIASDSRWDEFRRAGPRLSARIRRIGVLILVGYLLQMPRWSGLPPFDFSAEEWRYVLRSGVLTCVAVSLAIAHLLMALTRTKRGFARAALIGAALVVLTTRAITSHPLVSALPMPLAMLIRTNEGSLFPLFPWLGHFLCGAGIARVTLDSPSLLGTRRLGLYMGAGGLLFYGASFALRLIDPSRVMAPDYWVADPSLVLTRAGGAWCLFGLCTVVVGTSARSPAWLSAIGSRALSVYVAHLVLLYGLPFTPGISNFLGGKLPLWLGFVAGPCVLVLALWTAMATLWTSSKLQLVLRGAWSALFPRPGSGLSSQS